MAKAVVLRMTKYFNNNMIGEVCSFSEATAEHIIAHQGAVKLATIEVGAERYDVATGKVVPLRKA